MGKTISFKQFKKVVKKVDKKLKKDPSYNGKEVVEFWYKDKEVFVSDVGVFPSLGIMDIRLKKRRKKESK